MKWIDIKKNPLRQFVEVLAFNKAWVDEDKCPNGIRIGFLGEDGFISATWNMEYDCYDTVYEEGDDYYKGNAYVIEEEKKKALPNMPTHYILIPQCNADVLHSNEIEELLDFIPDSVEHDGVEGCFNLYKSVGGYWCCKYTGIIGFESHKNIQDALKEVILWIRNGMTFDKI